MHREDAIGRFRGHDLPTLLVPERQPNNRRTSETQKGTEMPQALFEGGWVLATPRALATLAEAEIEAIDLLARHLVGDWGDVNEAEKLLNDLAVTNSQRLTSVYRLPTGHEVWVTTSGDRQTTWLKLPDQMDPAR